MPTMLGLTTDKSPYAMQDQDDNDKQMIPRKSSSSQQVQRQGRRRDSKPHRQERRGDGLNNTRGDDMQEKPPRNSIYERNYQAAVEHETIMWRALCDDPLDAHRYMAEDAVVVNPLLFGDTMPRSRNTDPKLKDDLEHNCEKFLGCKLHDPAVVEVDLMGVVILYDLTLFRQTEYGDDGKGGFETVEASGSSTWRQVAGGDWYLVSMHATESGDHENDQ